MDYMQSKDFKGVLSINEHSLPVSFSALVDSAGAVQLSFQPIQINGQSNFIQEKCDPPGHGFGEFTLKGVAEDGAEFETADLIFLSLGRRFGSKDIDWSPVVDCSEARFRMSAKTSGGPCAKMLLKGVRSGKALSVATKLGILNMLGPDELGAVNDISGRFQIVGSGVENVEGWRSEVDALFEHARHVMSFASGAMLHAPLSEFIHDGKVELVARSQPIQEPSHMEPFSHRGLDQIFKTAVASHFAPEQPVEKLHYAIEWFCMSSAYPEANLITAMTVLENLISANLPEADTMIQGQKAFDKLRKKIRQTAKEHFADVLKDPEEESRMVADVNEKLGDLNRKSLKQKIDILAAKWGMSLGGLDEDMIKGAKKARDLVIHRGYYEHVLGENAPLFEHVVVARDLVVRFILTALRFDGYYDSYLGGWHPERFHLSTANGNGNGNGNGDYKSNEKMPTASDSEKPAE